MLEPQLLVYQDSESPPTRRDHGIPVHGVHGGGGTLRPGNCFSPMPAVWACILEGECRFFGGHRTGKQLPGEAGPCAPGVKVPAASLAAASKSPIINKIRPESFFFLFLSLRQIPK